MFGTYERLNLHVAASNLAVIRATCRMLHPRILRMRQHREGRHALYREMLRYHADAGKLYRDVMRGNI